MPRPRTGTVAYCEAKGDKPGHYRARITLADGARPWVALPPGPKSPAAERRARERALALSERASAEGWAPAATDNPRRKVASAPAGEGAEPWVAAWLDARRARGLTSVRENDAHWRCHLAPTLASKHPKDWTAEDMREVVRTLDAKAKAGELSWKTAVNAWGTCTSMCADAQKSKVEALRVRDDDPSRDVRGPDRGAKLAKQFLYPSEVAQLMACDAVPVKRRRTVAVAIYSYLRGGELRKLRREDVDREHGTVHVHRANDRTDGGEKHTKGAAARRVPVEPALMPLLRALDAEADGELVMGRLEHESALATNLRNDLRTAGITRAELFSPSATSRAITFHDLRATGITWMAVRGDAPMVIMQRAGHTDISTTMGYVRTAEVVREGFGEPFPELPAVLLAAPNRPWQSSRRLQVLGTIAIPAGIEPALPT